MMRLITLILFFVASIAICRNAPVIWSEGSTAKFLTNKSSFQNGVLELSGDLDPSSSSVNAPKGSLYYSTNGITYVKQDAGDSTNWDAMSSTTGTVTSIATSAPLAGGTITSSGTISISQSDTSTDGYLSSTDWNTFNNKEPALSKGDLTEATSSVLDITGGTGAVIGSGLTIEVDQADASNAGYLSSTDWNTFNNKSDTVGTVTSIDTGDGLTGGAITDNGTINLKLVGSTLNKSASGLKVDTAGITATELANVQALGDNIAIGVSSAATGNSIALGRESYAAAAGITLGWYSNAADNGVALGESANANGADSFSVGKGSAALGTDSIAIGANTDADGVGAIAIGDTADAQHASSIALGAGSETTAANQIRLGTASETVSIPGALTLNDMDFPPADGSAGYVMSTDGAGTLSWVADGVGAGDFLANGSVPMTGNLDVAANTILMDAVTIGDSAVSGGANSVVIGTSATASNGLEGASIAIGHEANAANLNAISISGGVAIGFQANGYGRGIAIGYKAAGNGITGLSNAAIAIGTAANAAETGIAIGENAKGLGGGIAIGLRANSAGVLGTAVGQDAYGSAYGAAFGTAANGQNFGSAFGAYTNANGSGRIAIGMDDNWDAAWANADNSIAIGAKANAQHASSIAFGASSATTSTNQIMLGTSSHHVVIPATVNGLTLNDMTFPSADGSANYVLSTDGAGTLSWGAAGGSGTVTSVATGSGLTGGTITDSGTISVPTSGITATHLANVAQLDDEIAMGTNAISTARGVAIGKNANANISDSIAIGVGADAFASGGGGIAIGGIEGFAGATASGVNSTAIQKGAVASGLNSIALGIDAVSSAANSIAVGKAANASHANSVALGASATTTVVNQIRLGTASETVSIAGGLELADMTFPASDGAATNVLTTDGAGTLSWGAAGGSGTVTSITAGTGLTGGTITDSGTIAIDTDGVTATQLLNVATLADEIAIGTSAAATTRGTAIGKSANSGLYASAFGYTANAGQQGTAIGYDAVASATQATALGYDVDATGIVATAIGASSEATHNYSSAFGFGATTTAANQIRLGRAAETVSIPGALTLNDMTFPAADGAASTVLQTDGAGTLAWVAGSTLTGLIADEADATVVTAKVNEIAGITIGACVYVSGATGDFPQVSLCDNTVTGETEFFGVSMETKADNQNMKVAVAGTVAGVNTSTFTEGDALYMSTGGTWTKTLPTSGWVGHNAVAIKINASTGIIGILRHSEPYVAATSGADVDLRMGDSIGATKVSFEDYSDNEVASINSDGNFSIAGYQIIGSASSPNTTAGSMNAKAFYDDGVLLTSNLGTVTSITAGTGLTGGTITDSGTISVPTSGITAVHLANVATLADEIAIGTSAAATTRGTAIGKSANGGLYGSAYGYTANSAQQGTAIGYDAVASGTQSTALGYDVDATAVGATSIGASSEATHNYSSAFGFGAATTAANQIRLGRAAETVSILGDLITDGQTGAGKQTENLGAGQNSISVTSNFIVVTGDAGANTIGALTSGLSGQIVTLLFVDALVTITDTDAHTANTVDLSAAFTSADDTILQVIFDGTSWYEVSRSVN